MGTGLAIAALVLSVNSLAFTGWQWSRSGPSLLIDVSGRSPLDEDTDVRAEIVSAGRLAVTVRMAQLEIEWSDGTKAYQPVEWLTGKVPVTLAPTEVLTVGFVLPDPPEATLVACCVTVEVLGGTRWSHSRLLPLG